MREKLIVLKLVLDELGIEPSIQTLRDRKRLQKAVYLSQIIGIDLGYRHGWYVRGPYSRELARDYYALAEALESGESDHEQYKLGADHRNKLTALKSELDPPDSLELSKEDWLELLASVHFLRVVWKQEKEKAKATLEETKPRLAPHFEVADSKIRELGLAS